MSTATKQKLGNRAEIAKALKAFEIVRSLSESELETLEILSNSQEKKIILKSLEESKKNKVYPLRSILKN